MPEAIPIQAAAPVMAKSTTPVAAPRTRAVPISAPLGSRVLPGMLRLTSRVDGMPPMRFPRSGPSAAQDACNDEFAPVAKVLPHADDSSRKVARAEGAGAWRDEDS